MKKRLLLVCVLMFVVSAVLFACGDKGAEYTVTVQKGDGIQNVTLDGGNDDKFKEGKDCTMTVYLENGYAESSIEVKANGTALSRTNGGTYVISDVRENYTVTVSASNIHDVTLTIDDDVNSALDSSKIEVYDGTTKVSFSNKKATLQKPFGELFFIKIKYLEQSMDRMTFTASDSEGENIAPVTRLAYLYNDELKADEAVFAMPVDFVSGNDGSVKAYELCKYTPDNDKYGENEKCTYFKIFTHGNSTYSMKDIEVPYGETAEFSVTGYNIVGSDINKVYIRQVNSLTKKEVSIKEVTFLTDNQIAILCEIEEAVYCDYEVVLELVSEGAYDFSAEVNFDNGLSGSYASASVMMHLGSAITSAKSVSKNKWYFNTRPDMVGYRVDVTLDEKIIPSLTGTNLSFEEDVDSRRHHKNGTVTWSYNVTAASGVLADDIVVNIGKKSDAKKSVVKLGSNKFYEQTADGTVESNKVITGLQYAIVDKTAAITTLTFADFDMTNGVELQTGKILIFKIPGVENCYTLSSSLDTFMGIKNSPDAAGYFSLCDIAVDEYIFKILATSFNS